ncbi:MobH family relaxase [Chitinimonas koreensis]|uniref:MobH family relaxase n=1 Tax=Chitinimonas koreensis TaxID=356302 RepID=UPI0003FBD1D1|nr:MobH family relaxase [Chitinimonas koreensis]QNM95535.1 TraI domain-containing protein [Chitinimonas koreensis]
MSLWLAGSVVVVGATVWWWLGRRPADTAGNDSLSTHADKGAKPPTTGRSPSDSIEVLDAAGLWALTKVDGRVERIRQSLGFSDRNWQDVLPLLQGVSEFVQRLPASESHHHAQPGGLLIHIFEVAEHAVRASEGREIPPGRSPEERAQLRHRWRYGVLVAALLHDIGKPLTDLRIEIPSADPQKPRLWNPLAGSLLECGAPHYRVRFAPSNERDYGLHQRAGIILFQRLIPSTARQWLAEDPLLMETLTAVLAGDADRRNNVMAELVSQADSKSVADNLANGSRRRFGSAKAVPLIERLMRALRTQLADGELPLNRAGAAGWVHDGCAWLVSKRVADACRDWLQAQPDAASQSGIPADNERLMDCWQEYGALRANPETGQAIWRIDVKHGDFQVPRLTVLCFPLDKLYESPAQYPAAFGGRITVGAGKAPAIVGGAEPAPTEAPLSEVVEPLQADALPPAARDADLAPVDRFATGPVAVAPVDEVDDDPFSFTPLPPTEVAPSPTITAQPSTAPSSRAATDVGTPDLPAPPRAIVSSHSPDGENPEDALLAAFGVGSANARPLPLQPARSSSEPPTEGDLEPVAEPLQASAVPLYAMPPALQVQAPNATVVPAVPAAIGLEVTERLGISRRLTYQLLAWVQQGVGSGALEHNSAKAIVHFVPEGMLLISPAVFHRFVESGARLELLPEPSADDQKKHRTPAQIVQRHVSKSRLMAPNTVIDGKGKPDTRWVHSYRTASGAVVHGFVLPNPESLFSPVPAPNPHLAKLVQASSTGASP